MDFNMAIILGLYLVGLLAIGAWASKKVKSSEDFIVAGRNLGFWLLTLMIVASICSGMTILGTSGLGYIGGWPTIWEQIFVPLSAAFVILVYGTKLHAISERMGYITIQDYLAQRFYSQRGLRGLSAVAGILVSLIYLVGQYVAISMVLSWMLKISYTDALLIGAIIVMIYTILGGLYAIAWISLVQGLMILIGVLIVSPFIIQSAGGLTHVNNVLAGIDPNYVKIWYPQMHPPYAKYAFLTPMYLVSFFFLLTFGLASAPHVINNVLSARSRSFFKWSPLAAFVLYLIVMYLIKISGFASRVMVEEGMIALPTNVSNAQDYAFVVAAMHIFPHTAGPLVAVIVLSAVMSTTDRLMLTIGSYVGWDIYKMFFNKKASDRSITLVSRLAIVFSVILTLILAWRKPPELLAFLIWMGIGIMLATFVVPILSGLYWRRATREGAIASMSLGLIGALVAGWYHWFVSPLPVHFSFYGFLLSIAAMVVVSLLTRSPPADVLDETMTGMYIRTKSKR
ncbi:MAG: sodium:solute symporter family protein [Methanothrix sp.]|jgi:SSS family solute:Na+ symporter|uniref:Na+/solute symporter n=1 Tax=Methanothrix thermoacetophila (strain DSM 6194 / JCM 14653 / NBRC 101360 / PT) TaxID=349307 RepID=A0B5Y0_METTP|nr:MULTISPECIES: sodium:solute symporter family protein [Methanothrix]ABK14104.1 Na+/solute symporter [Methanothrix thermoacetophila PT]MBC7079791.1 sodium:solute symporter family protein [Methanothrix sp.]NPU87868.1 sodium:solute symporter family protein [Methanothrix sp.]